MAASRQATTLYGCTGECAVSVKSSARAHLDLPGYCRLTSYDHYPSTKRSAPSMIGKCLLTRLPLAALPAAYPAQSEDDKSCACRIKGFNQAHKPALLSIPPHNLTWRKRASVGRWVIPGNVAVTFGNTFRERCGPYTISVRLGQICRKQTRITHIQTHTHARTCGSVSSCQLLTIRW